MWAGNGNIRQPLFCLGEPAVSAERPLLAYRPLISACLVAEREAFDARHAVAEQHIVCCAEDTSRDLIDLANGS